MSYDYDIAISFAGEDRSIADQIANKLKANGVKVFYDAFEEDQLWGQDLYVYLHEIYSTKAQYCIMLLSEHYAKKAWTNHERQSAQERAFKENKAYILPIKIDGTTIPGIRDTVGYLSLLNKSIDDVVAMTLSKLGNKASGSTGTMSVPNFTPNIPLPQIARTFSERDRDKFADSAFATIRDYFKAGIKQLDGMADIEADFKEINATKFICKVYVQGKIKSVCTIWIGSHFSSNGINYVSQADPNAGSTLNNSLTVEIKDGVMGLKPIMDVTGTVRQLLNEQEAAEYYWRILITPLNRGSH